jgi:hypothetical protein
MLIVTLSYECPIPQVARQHLQSGDEALMCLETFRRNGLWHILFPHSKTDPSKS